MSHVGFDKSRFPILQGQIFDCLICSQVVQDPKQCNSCGNLYCGICIDDWMKKNNSCPNRCVSSISAMSSGALKKIYNTLQIKCTSCPKIFSLCQIKKHQIDCKKTKCWNHEICSGYQNKEVNLTKAFCSTKCELLFSIFQTGNDVKKMYKILLDLKPNLSVNSKSISQKSINSNFNGQLKWDNNRCGTGITFENAGYLVCLKQQSYVFRSVVANHGFTSGIHYWQIIADNRTQNQLKIGVSTLNNFDFNTAFCDYPFGWAFYGLGQLRHHSNASGPQYGKRFKKQGTLGVYLNMNKGTLAFSLNGECMGVAYQDNNLTKGPIYPAVSLLHAAVCTIKGQLPVPAIFQGL